MSEQISNLQQSTHSNIDTKRIAKNTLVLYVRMFIMLVIGLYTSRVILNTLGVSDYGIYNVVGGVVTVLSFLNSAMAGATQRYINIALGKREQKQLNKIISNSLVLHFVIALIILILAETVGLWFVNTYLVIPIERINAVNWVYQFSIFSFLVAIIQTPYNASIIAHEKMTAYAWITLFDVFMKLIIVFSLLFVTVDKLILYAALQFVGANITRLIYVRYCKKHFTECSIQKWNIDKRLMKSMFSFSSWTILGNFSYIGHTQGIAILINIFFGVTVNAAQGVANQINVCVKQFISNFTVALNPQIVKTYASNEIEAMHSLIFRGCKMSILMISLLVIPLILETPMILRVWLKLVPDYTVIFVRLILIITLFESFSSPLVTAQGATGNIKYYQILLTSIGLLHLPLTWLFFTFGYDAYYAQYVYLVIVIVIQIIRVLWVANSVDFSLNIFLKDVILRCVLSITVALIIPVILHIFLPSRLFTALVVCVVSVICMVLCSLFIGFSNNERTAILNILIKKININRK